jgi:hypothetical protein
MKSLEVAEKTSNGLLSQIGPAAFNPGALLAASFRRVKQFAAPQPSTLKTNKPH